MSSINNEQRQLLFDYCVGLTSQEQTAEAEALISSNQEAAEIHSRLQATLAPLESVEFEPCPDGLVERTVRQVSNLADSGQHRLEQLLVSEQTQKVTTKVTFWRNLSEMAAVAAAIILVTAVLVPSLSFARQKYRQQRCRMQLGSIFQGLSNYISDHDGQPPAVTTKPGAAWWKVGSKDNENCSNTRHIWLLVKGNYVKPTGFVCPGCKNGKTLQSNPSQIRTYKDFPNRKNITYSFRIRCRMRENGRLLCRKVLMADLSPLFEKLPDDHSKSFKLHLNPELLILNSINHRRRGQNVLFGDGRVEFLKTRHTGISKDDIFTLQDTDIYQGCEVPSCATDSFLAP
ncbi:MAG: hypothetical protein ACYS9C_12435 [Planctomycetota bacterium]|jgi:hypothetical protein